MDVNQTLSHMGNYIIITSLLQMAKMRNNEFIFTY